MNNIDTHEPVFLIEVDKIVPNPDQPRRDFDETALRELANSIREVGLIQPIIVSKIEKETETGTEVHYQLIAGERRLKASKLLGLERIPAIVKKVNLERERLELALIENIQRANLNPIEEARAYARFQDEFGMTQREVATRLGKSREVVANALRLLNLPTEIQDAIAQSELNESQARLLLAVSDPAEQKALFDEVVRNSLSVRQLRDRIQRVKAPTESTENGLPRTVDPEIIQIQKDLETLLGTQVKLEKTGDTGKITISFFSSEELRHIIERLTAAERAEIVRTSEEDNFSIGTSHDETMKHHEPPTGGESYYGLPEE
jgi:ParB family transcriptional regulator, chromosome partitioning protein